MFLGQWAASESPRGAVDPWPPPMETLWVGLRYIHSSKYLDVADATVDRYLVENSGLFSLIC